MQPSRSSLLLIVVCAILSSCASSTQRGKAYVERVIPEMNTVTIGMNGTYRALREDMMKPKSRSMRPKKQTEKLKELDRQRMLDLIQIERDGIKKTLADLDKLEPPENCSEFQSDFRAFLVEYDAELEKNAGYLSTGTESDVPPELDLDGMAGMSDKLESLRGRLKKLADEYEVNVKSGR